MVDGDGGVAAIVRLGRLGVPAYTTYSNVSFSAQKTWIPGSLEACYAP